MALHYNNLDLALSNFCLCLLCLCQLAWHEHVAALTNMSRWLVFLVVLCNTCTLPWPPIFQSIYDFGLSRWRREQEETFALPVGLSADSSHQSLPLALQDDELEWSAYLSRLGFNEVSAPPPLIGSYLLHQVSWQVSKPNDPGSNLKGRFGVLFEVKVKIASPFFKLNPQYDKEPIMLIGFIFIHPWKTVWVPMRFI